MSIFLQLIIYGISIGFTYGLFALGYTIIFGVVGVLNLAHAAIFTIAGIIAYVLVTSFGFHMILAIFVAALVAAVCGVLGNLIFFQPLRRRGIPGGSMPIFLGSVMLGGIGLDIALRTFGPDTRAFPQGVWPEYPIRLGFLETTTSAILINSLSIAMVFVLWYIIYRTRVGKAMRAISADERASALMGINVDNIIALTFALASFLGGIAGVLIGAVFGNISAFMAGSVEVKGLIIMIVGGIGSISGALLVSLLIGVTETIASYYISTMYSPLITYVILFLVLYTRPQGLLPVTRE